MKVSDIATLNVRSCDADTNLATVASYLWEQDCGVVPVVDETRRVLGVVTDRDICMAAATRPAHVSQIPAKDLMTGKPCTCRLADDARVALRVMTQNGVRRLPVVDEIGRLVGILSLADFIRASRDPRTARAGELTWADVIPMLGAVTLPRTPRETPLDERTLAPLAMA